jgi:hypothetical protein
MAGFELEIAQSHVRSTHAKTPLFVGLLKPEKPITPGYDRSRTADEAN